MSNLKCTDLDYGPGVIKVAEIELPFTVDDWLEPHVNYLKPTSMLAGYNDYVFTVTGSLND